VIGRLSLILAAACAATLAAIEAPAAQSVQIAGADDTVAANSVRLKGLDTLNGTTKDIPVRVGEILRYGYLELIVDTCRVPRDDPEADAYAFLRIRDVREGQPGFSGWMFASSPALSALDHPRYDIWVESCSIS
jgi:hypothetical protein